MDFEIDRIDPLSVRLTREGFAEEREPVTWAYADVGTPIVGGLCACHKLRGDGIDDLVIRFSTRQMARTLQLDGVNRQDAIELTVSGYLFDGRGFQASDCIVVVGRPWWAKGWSTLDAVRPRWMANPCGR